MPDDALLKEHPARSKHHWPAGWPPFDCIVLLLQGDGALGSYQAGVYETLAETELHPDWVAGISILSAREGAILKLIAEGLSNKEIARNLAIGPETVKTHVKHIFTKLNVEKRAQAVSRAQSLGLDNGRDPLIACASFLNSPQYRMK
jgi:DNA-binding CsgD family transcriptional regulator